MKLLIVSAMDHYRRDGEIVGWGPTVAEIDHLATRFAEVRHLACLHDTPAPASSLPYTAPNVRLLPLPPSGGPNLVDKLGVARQIPSYLGAIRRQLPWADVVHVRCPANVSLLAIVLLALVRRPAARWVKYAGNWRPPSGSGEARSYTFQRWWLRRRLHRGWVTVNGSWPGDPFHVLAFPNPSLTRTELRRAAEKTAAKRLERPPRLLFVGRLEEPKGADRALRVVARLRERGLEATLELVGDGPERASFEELARKLGVERHAFFRGWMARSELEPLYARAHFLLLPSRSSEGWPKVLSEAMAYGTVPLASAVSCIAQILARSGTGRALAPGHIDGYAAAVAAYLDDPDSWERESRTGRQAADGFTYEHYLDRVDDLLRRALKQ